MEDCLINLNKDEDDDGV